jgi:hypothetical protein
MGSAQSKAVSDTKIVNKAVTDVMMESSSNCSASSSASQTMSFNDIRARGCSVDFSNISQDATITTNFTCAQDSNQNTDLLNKFGSKLDQSVEATLKGLSGAVVSKSEAQTITNAKNEIKNNINLSQVANCIAKSMADQKMQFGKIEVDCRESDPGDKKLSFRNISQKLIATQTSKCMQSNAQVVKAINELETILTTKTKAANEGIDLASFASLGAWLLPLIIGCIIVSLAIISSVFAFSQSDAGQQAVSKLSDVAAERLRNR